MTFQWSKFLDLAKTLAAATNDDASLRSAVSRAYYCAFNLALARAKGNSYRPPEDAGIHDQLWGLYSRNDDKTCAILAILGQRMKRRRVKADYHLSFDRLDDEVTLAIADAEQFLSLLSGLGQDLPKDVPRKYSF